MVFAAAGMWRPPAEAVKQVRDAIVAKPDGRRAVRACSLRTTRTACGGRRAVTIPTPLVTTSTADLHHEHALTQAQACAPDFGDRFAPCAGAGHR